MKQHSTNDTDTFIVVAEDCPATVGTVPPEKPGNQTVANLQYRLLNSSPYQYTSDDVLFLVHATRNNLEADQYPSEREKFFSKGQPCLRCSPLGKKYGWGIHMDGQRKVAIYGKETPEYESFSKNKNIRVVKAIRSSKAKPKP